MVRLDLGCEPAPCSLKLDNETVQPGKMYVIAGTHVATASGEGNAEATERLTFDAGAAYRVVLHVAAKDQPKAASVTETAPAASASAAPATPPPPATTTTKPETAPAASSDAPPDHPTDSPRKPLPPAAFVASGAVTLVLAGVMTWSGIDTLSAKSNYLSTRTPADYDAVTSKESRTNVFLVATGVVGVATAVVGLTLVDWHAGHAEAAVAPVPGGGVVGASGRF